MRTTFNVALVLALLHAADDAFLHRQPGVELSTHAPAAGLVAVLAAAGFVLFGRLRPGLQAALALSYGSLALTNGALHVIHLSRDGASGSDLSGLLAVAAGGALI
ncbi:MAG TPA: hypothetical protein VGV67_08500, partial [Solirubrobacteraceae bacterium]|nr:hypothetical protein [Solirubrobacteraceae bacterium]